MGLLWLSVFVPDWGTKYDHHDATNHFAGSKYPILWSISTHQLLITITLE